MLEQELKKIWKDSDEIEKIKFDFSRLIIDLNGKMNKLEGAIRRRNRREVITASVMIPVFGALAYLTPFPLTKMGIILATFGYCFYVYKIRDHRKQQPPIYPRNSFRDQLESWRSNLLQEARFSSTILYWFLIPSIIPYVVSILGLGDPQEYGYSNSIINQILPMSPGVKLINIALAIIVFTTIYWSNKRLVEKVFKPLIEDIEKVQYQFEQEG